MAGANANRLRWAAGPCLSLVFARPSWAKPPSWKPIDTVPGFSGWRKELQRRVDQEGRARTNHFCVVTEVFRPPQGLADAQPPPEETVARIYWRA